MCTKNNNLCNCFVEIIVGLVSAAGIGALFFSGLITTINIIIYLSLALSIIGLIYLIYTLICGSHKQCYCLENSNLIPSTFGGILTSALALSATTLPTASISTAILIGSIAFFLLLNLISIINIIFCKSCGHFCICGDNCEK